MFCNSQKIRSLHYVTELVIFNHTLCEKTWIRGKIMKKIKNTEDFKKFLRDYGSEIMKKTVRLQEMVEDDEWVKENEWDELYEVANVDKNLVYEL